MSESRKYILTIGGFDPCNGAGITADAKTAEAIGVYALSVQTCVTIQNEAEIRKIYWHDFQQIKEQIDVLTDQYEFEFVKLSLTNGLRSALEIVTYIKKVTDTKIIWDPVMQSSSGYEFYKGINADILKSILEKVYLATPNWEEMKRWVEGKSPTAAASQLAKTTNIYLKGGHNIEAIGVDYLFYDAGKIKKLASEKISKNLKHGSGCVFASALTAYLAKGLDVVEASQFAKNYTFQFLESATSVLGEHRQFSELNATPQETNPTTSMVQAPSVMKSFEPLTYFHIENKGEKDENLFVEEANYIYCISLIQFHISPIAHILAYSLLPHQLQLVVQFKSENEIPAQWKNNLTQPFTNLFMSFNQSMQKQHGAGSNLFQKTYEKHFLADETQLKQRIIDVHINTEKHQITEDFRQYPYSSFQNIILKKDRLVDANKCIEHFKDVDTFLQLHEEKQHVIYQN
jgi:hydroxymethylpyrimidine/phosphomethylpyrimidine kinase